MIHIPFNIPPYIGNEEKYIQQVIRNRKICGDGDFTKKCNSKLEEMTGSAKALVTTSGSSALEMAALLAEIHLRLGRSSDASTVRTGSQQRKVRDF